MCRPRLLTGPAVIIDAIVIFRPLTARNLGHTDSCLSAAYTMKPAQTVRPLPRESKWAISRCTACGVDQPVEGACEIRRSEVLRFLESPPGCHQPVGDQHYLADYLGFRGETAGEVVGVAVEDLRNLAETGQGSVGDEVETG